MVNNADLQEWQVLELEKATKTINIGFKRPKAKKQETPKKSKEEVKNIRTALLKGEYDIDSAKANQVYLKSGAKLDFMNDIQKHYSIQADQFGSGRFDSG